MGNPAIRTVVTLTDGHQGIADVPSGTSKGENEAIELLDHDSDRFNGMGVLKAIDNVNKIIAPALKDVDATKQTKVDQRLLDLDGTKNKSKLGANAILSVSQAVLESAAAAYRLPIYLYLHKKYYSDEKISRICCPVFNIINGGAHGNGNLDFQEFHIIPSLRFSYRKGLQLGQEIYQSLKTTLKHRHAYLGIGEEGGFIPELFNNLDAIEIILEAISSTNYRFGKDVFLGLDPAANHFYKKNKYSIKDRALPFSKSELINYYQNLNRQYNLLYLEDPLEEEDWTGWEELTSQVGNNTLVVGDDLLTTNKDRVKKAAEMNACNSILIKPNQVGTISETVEVVKNCQKLGWKIIVSHRSGETNDNFIADFAIGVGADYTKFGAPARGERIIKYNRLLEISDQLKLNGYGQ